MDHKSENIDDLRRMVVELERQIDAVRRIAINLSTAMEVQELVREALNISLSLTQSEAGSILLYDPDKEKLVFEHVVGEKADELTGLELEPTQGLAGVAFNNREILVTDDVKTESAHLRELGEKIGYVTQNMVTVPLMSPEIEPLGVMQIINKRGAKFDQYDVKLIETIAAQIAVAIKTAHLQQEARLAAIMRFIGNISHDVKNMITPASVGAETLEKIAGSCYRQFDECLDCREEAKADERVAQLADSMAKLRKSYPDIVELILEACDAVQQRMAQISAAMKGTVSEPHFEPTNVPSIAQRVATMLQVQAERKGITLHIDTAQDLPAAMVDGKQIYNAIYNLILNAIDACSSGSSVTLRFACQPEGDFPEGNYIILECADTGPGMPDHVKAKIFTDKVVSTKAMGTGLGTRIIKDVVEAHQGVIELESEVGSGTTIRCRMPLKRKSDE